MSYHVFIIKTDGTINKTVQPKAPTYEQQKAAVGGYIETIPYFTKLLHDGRQYTRGTAFCNEEGIVIGMPVNSMASALWRISCPTGDPSRMVLCGDVIFYAKVKE